MKKLVNCITYSFVFLGIYYLLYTIWKELEITMYGFSQESTVDTIIGAFVCITLTVVLAIWKAIVDNK